MDTSSTLYYALYPPPSTTPAAATEHCALIAARVRALLGPSGWVWHKDAFDVRVALDDADAWGLRVEGHMRVGDSVEDEWVVVWALREVSREWKDWVIEVHDTDGQFLLIEAADVLPRWVTPSNAINRLWIHSGSLHLIPPQHTSRTPRRRRPHLPSEAALDERDDSLRPSDSSEWIDHLDALALVRNPAVDTRAPPEVEHAAFKRTEVYPGALPYHQHTFHAFVPRDVARVLALTAPEGVVDLGEGEMGGRAEVRQAACELAQRAVEAFASRDASGMRAAQKMSRFPPSSTRSSPARAALTRTSYAQLLGQKFYPPKVFEPSTWPKEGVPGVERERRERGMKLAVGFEILYAESKSSVKPNAAASEAAALSDAQTSADPAYKAYIDGLAKAGYFGGELEGSVRWQARESEARRVWSESRARDPDASRPTFAQTFERLLALAPADPSPAAPDARDDDDAWLSVDPRELDALMGGPSAPVAEREGQEKEEQEAQRLGDMAKRFGEFVEGKGDVEGAVFREDILSDEEDEDEESDEEGEGAGERKEMSAQEKADAMDRLVTPLPAGEWGAASASASAQPAPALPPPSTTDLTAAAASANGRTPTGEKAWRPAPEPARAPMRRPLFPREKFEGASDSDDDSDADAGEAMDAEGEEVGEDAPQIVDDGEGGDVPMGEEEQVEFLKFSREALGIDDRLWEKIVKDREDRGAFLPKSTTTAASAKSPPQPRPKGEPPRSSVRFSDAGPTPSTSTAPSTDSAAPRRPTPGPRPNANPQLDSFEAVMAAMDAELAKRKPSAASSSSAAGAGAAENEDEDKDAEMRDLAAMDAELKAILERVDPDGTMLEDDEDIELPEGAAAQMDEGAQMDYNLIKNFLESFKAQAGLSGPVSNLAGAMGGFRMPRDES